MPWKQANLSSGDSQMRDKRLKWALRLVLAWIILAAIGPCTITHKFGPYYGKVVEQDSGEPIEGAAVLVEFRTLLYTPAGFTSHFVDALETVTDQNGEFHISPHRAWVFRFPHKWEKNCIIIVFKPGYGAYPEYKGIKERYDPGNSIPENEPVTIKLPRLESRAERQRNLTSMLFGTVPEGKRKILQKLIETERKDLGNVTYKK
jgi:hypothetical protein